MRTRLIAAVAALAAGLLVAGTAAQSATPGKRYLRFSAGGYWAYTVDLGDDPSMVYNGTFTWTARLTIRGIAVYAGRSVWIPAGAMIVDSEIGVSNNVTVWTPGRPHQPSRCDTPHRTSDGLRLSSGGYISISSSGLYVNPGRAVVASPPCNTIESMVHHGLPAGPTFTLPAPARSRFSGRAAFSIGCSEPFSHDWQWVGNQKHKFTGDVTLYGQFTPFPKSALAATKRNLRAQVGKTPASTPAPEQRRDCL